MREKLHLLPGILLIGLAGGVTSNYIIDEVSFASFVFVVASFAGACTIVFFGRSGAEGWGWALWGGVLATVGASSAFGLTFGLSDFYELPLRVGQTLWKYPSSAVLWCVLMGLAHLVTLGLRKNQKQSFSK